MHHSSNRTAGWAGLALAAVGSAHAGCEPAIAAYDKADATQRYAVYDVEDIANAPKGDPLVVVIGDAEYAQQYDRKRNYAKAGYTKGGHTAGFEGRALKEREKNGRVRCEPLGERKIGSEAVLGYRIRDNKGSAPDPTAIELWVGRASGLPVFHGMGSDNGGFRWVFGAGVVAPAAGAGK
jgi:hypothetical protein